MKKQKSGAVWKFLLSYLSRQRLALFGIFCAAALVSAGEIAGPYLIGRAVDQIAQAGHVDFGAILVYISVLAGIYSLVALFTYLVGRLSYNVGQNVVRQMRADAYDRLMQLPLEYYDSRATGDTMSLFINDATAVADGLIDGITQLFGGAVTIFGTLAIMLVLSPAVTICVLLITSITFLVANRITRYSTRFFRENQALTGALGGFAEEMTGSLRTVKAFRYEEAARVRFSEHNKALADAWKKATFASSLTNPTTRFVNYLAYIAVGVVGALFGLSAGTISSFILYSNQFARPFNQITAILTQVMAAFAAARRVANLLNERPEETLSSAKQLQAPAGRVEFDHVSFSYTPDKPLIQDFSFVAEPGSRIAIVGPTGAGKTTLVNLIMRFYDVNSGAIRIDGTDIREVTRESLRRNIAMVLQETWLFEGTIRENIAYGRDVTDEQVVAAAKAAWAHSFIERLPQGYDTVLSAHSALSEGQRQLLTIARAMLGGENILLLDEATSRVDVLTEHRITKAFEELMRGKTSFIIAHRLSTIRDADWILVMKDGRIIEQGNHETLLAKGGFYRELYESQFAQAKGEQA